MKFLTLYRDAGAASPGGGLPPSLADLSDPNYKPVTDLTDPPPAGDPPAGDPPPATVEGIDAEGNLLEGYEKAEDGTVRKIEAGDPGAEGGEEGDDEVTPDAFYAEVQAKTNFEVQVDYKDVDPLSPEGVALRELAIRDTVEEQYDNYIKANLPRAYAYMLHLKNGGTDEEFFAVKHTPLADKETFSSNLDAQRNFLVADLIAKDVPEDVAKLTVDSYIKNNTLTDKALALYDKKKAEESALLATQIKRDEELKAEFNNKVASLNSVLTNGIEKEMKLVVPADRKAAFHKFIVDNIEHDGKDFYLAQKLDVKQITPGFLEALYLQYVKGDVSALIQREAKRQTVQRLGQRVKNDKTNSSSQRGDDKAQSFIPLSQI